MRGGFARGGVQPLRAGDHCAERGGGVVLVPPGTFRVAELAVRPGVALTGAGVERTTFRACGAAAGSAMFPSFLRPQVLQELEFWLEAPGRGWRSARRRRAVSERRFEVSEHRFEVSERWRSLFLNAV